jgi:type IV pilus assembly protein PilY1
MWPQPCDPEALLVGESSGDFVPKPPPIGPVAITRDGGAYTITTAAGTKVQADERWIVFVNGGFDPYMVRGRALAMIDLATGRSLWTFRYQDGSPNAAEARYPFSAPVSMLDMGNSSGSNRDQDRLFDTATVGDMGGSVWTVRFWVPGEVDPSTNQVTNWFAARSFQAQGASDLSIRPAITYMTSNAVQPDTGYLRTFVGTGDRYNLLDSPGNICRLSNPRACALQGCVARSQITVTRGGVETNYAKVQFSNQSYETDTYRAASGGSACLSSKISVGWDLDTGGQCVTTNVAPGMLEYTCDGSASTWSCRTTTDNWLVTSDKQSTPFPATGPHRFYGFHSYGVTRTFGTGSGGVAGDRASALAFDQARLTEARLVDVTDATVDASGKISVSASALGDGWYIRYVPLDERTATTATVLDGCVLWNSFQPSAVSSLCSSAGNNLARLYQAGFVDGAPNCAAAFYISGTWVRHLDRSVTASPAPPTPQRSVYKGNGSTGIASPEAGGMSSTSVTENRELVQSVYHLLVDRRTHDCRHENASCE